MTNFKAGTWIYDGDKYIICVEHSSTDWSDCFKELKHAPNLEVVEEPKLKRLSEVVPRVGMNVTHGNLAEAWPILVVLPKGVCIARGEFPQIIDIHDYAVWVVVDPAGEPACSMTVEESLRPEHFGKKGKWKLRDGETVVDTVKKSDTTNSNYTRYPVTVDGAAYTREGRYFADGEDSDYDLVEFLGWED
jgi:hypothetical protein